MKVMLLSPNIKGTINGINRIQPPLGIAYLISYLKNDHEVYFRDTALEGYENKTILNDKMIIMGESDQHIRDYIKSINPDVIGISILFSNLIDGALNICKIIKEINTNIKVIVGGNYITNLINDYNSGYSKINDIYDKNIDYYFYGESEINFLNFLKDFDETTNGLCFIKNGNLIQNKSGFLNIISLKDPSWEYFNMEKYFDIGLFHSANSYSTRVLPVMASRGCPEKCSFCSTPMTWGAKVRWKDPKLLFKEIKTNVEKYNIQEIQFQDDTLTANKKYLTELCSYISDLKIPWCTPNGLKINYHQKNQYEMFKMMKDSGCYQITFACESGSQRVLDEIIRKNIKVNTFKDNIKKAKDAGLFVHTFWIVGFPEESYSEIQQTIEIAAQCESDSYSLSIFSPLQGTPLYHKVMKENLWWDDTCNIQNMTFRNSLIKVDGFNSATEFETYVEKNNAYLNSLLKENDPVRAILLNKNRGIKLSSQQKLQKQT